MCAAGNWGIDAAWYHVEALIAPGYTDKDLLLAAIDAAASIRPQEARSILLDLSGSDDEDVADAALESMAMIEPGFDEDDADEDEDYFA